jgi:hypothetical protein
MALATPDAPIRCPADHTYSMVPPFMVGSSACIRAGIGTALSLVAILAMRFS